VLTRLQHPIMEEVEAAVSLQDVIFSVGDSGRRARRLSFGTVAMVRFV
jgi:hypothetical protein